MIPLLQLLGFRGATPAVKGELAPVSRRKFLGAVVGGVTAASLFRACHRAPAPTTAVIDPSQGIRERLESVQKQAVPYLAKIDTRVPNFQAKFFLVQVLQTEKIDADCQQQIYKMLEHLAIENAFEGSLGLYTDGISAENVHAARRAQQRYQTASDKEKETFDAAWDAQEKVMAGKVLCSRGHYDFRAASCPTTTAAVAKLCVKYGLLTSSEAINFEKLSKELADEKLLPAAETLGAQAILLPYLVYALKVAMRDLRTILSPESLSKLPPCLRELSQPQPEVFHQLNEIMTKLREDLDDQRGEALLKAIVAGKDYLGISIMNHGYDWTKLVLKWNRRNPSQQFEYLQFVPEALRDKPYINSNPSRQAEMIRRQHKLLFENLKQYIELKQSSPNSSAQLA